MNRAIDLAREAIARIVEVQIVERAIALAALAFTALVPPIAVYATVAPGADADALSNSIVRLSVVVALGLAAALWLFTPWVLLSRRIAWRRLAPTALLTATAMTALSAASIVYMPRSIADSAERYGPVGVSIALVSWLVGAGFVLVGAAAIGAVLARDDGGLQAGEAR